MANAWFRLYAEFANDPKVQMLTEQDQRRFVMLLCLRCGNDGETLHDDQVAFQLRISLEEWGQTKAILIEKGMIDECAKPLAWDRRQYVSDSSAARVSAHRERKKTQAKQVCNVTVTPPDTDTDTDTDTEKPSCDQQAESPKERIPFEKIRVIYNEVCGHLLPEAIKLDDKRKRNIRKCWGMNIDGATPFQSGDFWRQYFIDCLDDTHWTGTNDRGWRANIEFLTRESSVLKVLERT